MSKFQGKNLRRNLTCTKFPLNILKLKNKMENFEKYYFDEN